jgi:hypothetical protein
VSTAGCSRGLHPFRVLPARSLVEISPDLLSRASLSRSADQTQRRLRVSIGSRLVPTRACGDPTSWNGTTLLGFQHREIPVIRAGHHPGLWFRLVSRHTLLLTADTLWMVVLQTSLYRSCWDLLEVPSVRDLIVATRGAGACGVLQSVRACCLLLRVTARERPLAGLATRSECMSR